MNTENKQTTTEQNSKPVLFDKSFKSFLHDAARQTVDAIEANDDVQLVEMIAYLERVLTQIK